MPKHSRLGRSIALATALTLGLVACGGDDDESAAPEATTDDTATADDTATEGATGEDPGGETPSPVAGETCEPEVTDVRLATSPPEFDTLTDAYWLQLLEEGGLSVETFEFESSPDTVRAVAAGEGDVINTSPLAIMQYIQESGGGLTVMAVELLTTDYLLLAQPEIESLEDLRGEVIGISTPGDLSDSLTRLMLERAGVGVDGIEFAEIGGTSARVSALAAGQIKAGAVHAADALTAAEEYDLSPLVNFADYIPEYAQRFLAASPGWLEDNPCTAQFLVDSMIEAQRWSHDNKEGFLDLSAEVVPGIPRDIAAETYEIFMSFDEFFGVNGGMDKIEPTAQVEVDQGNLNEDFVGTIDEWTTSEFVDDYIERNGTY